MSFLLSQVDIAYLCKKIADAKGNPFDIPHYVCANILNSVWRLLFGKTFEYENDRLVKHRTALYNVVHALGSGPIVICMPPWLYKIWVQLPFTRMHAARKGFKEIVNLIKYSPPSTPYGMLFHV